MNKIEDAKALRWRAVDDVEALMAKAVDAHGNPRDLTEHENRLFETLKHKIEGLDSDIVRLQAEAMRKAASAVPQAQQIDHPPSAWSSNASVPAYSLSRLVRAVCDHGRCAEMDISERLKANFGAGNGFALPFVIEKTALAGVLGAGGALTPDVHTSLIDALLAPSLLTQLPALTRISVPRGQGSIIIPRVNSTSTAAWIGEGNAASPVDPVFGQIQLTPRNAMVYCRFSRLLLQTSSPAIDGILQTDMASALSAAIDTALLSGAGVGNEPTGIIAQAGATVTESEQANLWATLSAAVTSMDAANVPQDQRAWLVNPATAGRLRTEFVQNNSDASDGTPILAPSTGLLGIRLVVHSAMPTTTALLIHQPDIVVASWGTMSAVIDPYSQAESGLIRIVISQLIDIALRHTASVIKLTLSS